MAVIHILRTNPELAYAFTVYVLRRNAQVQQDLASSLLNSTEERLARVLSFLNRLRKSGELVPRLSQQDVANAIGVTRQRVNFLMKRLRSQSRRPAAY